MEEGGNWSQTGEKGARRREKNLWEIKVCVEEAAGHGMCFPEPSPDCQAHRAEDHRPITSQADPLPTCSPTGKSERKEVPARPAFLLLGFRDHKYFTFFKPYQRPK